MDRSRPGDNDEGTLGIRASRINGQGQQSLFAESKQSSKHLEQSTRKVNVTADGAAYYERVLRLLADMDDAETSLSSASASWSVTWASNRQPFPGVPR